VTFGGVPTARTVVAADGITTINTGLVWVGSFGNEAFSFNPALTVADNVSAITTTGTWRQFGLDTATNLLNAGVSGSLTLSLTGKIGGSITDNSSGATKADFFNNRLLYLWIFNASTTASATEMGIFRATAASPAWNFPPNAGGLGDGLTYGTTTGAAATITALGSAGSSTSGTLQLAAAIPEPSVGALLGLAFLGLAASKHKFRRN